MDKIFNLGFDCVEIGPIVNQTNFKDTNNPENELPKLQTNCEIAKYNLKPYIRDDIIGFRADKQVLVNIQPSTTIVNT